MEKPGVEAHMLKNMRANTRTRRSQESDVTSAVRHGTVQAEEQMPHDEPELLTLRFRQNQKILKCHAKPGRVEQRKLLRLIKACKRIAHAGACGFLHMQKYMRHSCTCAQLRHRKERGFSRHRYV